MRVDVSAAELQETADSGSPLQPQGLCHHQQHLEAVVALGLEQQQAASEADCDQEGAGAADSPLAASPTSSGAPSAATLSPPPSATPDASPGARGQQQQSQERQKQVHAISEDPVSDVKSPITNANALSTHLPCLTLTLPLSNVNTHV